MSSKKPFAPWVRLFQFGGLFFFPGLAVTYWAVKQTPIPIDYLCGGLGLLGVSGMLLNSGLTRWSGKQFEQSSIKVLKFPEGWSATPNYMLPRGGDIDLHIESPDGKTFAVEIKTIHDIVVKIPFLGLGAPQLLTPGGKKLKEDPIPQTLRNAQAVSGIPVLWLPKGKAKTVKLRNGVIIVQGNKRALFKAIGCKTVGWSW